MDISIRIEALVPAADYFGVPSDKASYDALTWNDPRQKPTWGEIKSAGAAEKALLDSLAARKMLADTDRDMARGVEELIDALKAKGAIADADLPASLRDKISQRKAERAKLR